MPVTVRPQEPADRSAVRSVLTDALADGPMQIALVAELDEESVGSIMLSRFWRHDSVGRRRFRTCV